MVCSRCGEEGHRRNSQGCPYFYTNPNFRSTRTHPVPTGPDQPVPRVASIPANNSPPILVQNGPNFIAYRIIIPAITSLMQKLEQLFTRTESLIMNNDPDQYTTTRDPATIHDELNQMKNLYYVLYPVIHNQMMDFETNITTNNLDSLAEGYTRLLRIDRELNLFILMTFNYECGEWIRGRPITPQRLFTEGVAQTTPRTLSVLISIETENQSTTQCSICLDEKKHGSVCLTECNHDLCVECMCQYINSRHGRKELPCPLCRSDIKSVVCHGHHEYKMLCDTRDQTQPRI